MDKNWLEVCIVTSSEASEAVSGILYNTGVKGISIADSNDVEFKKTHKGDWDYFDESLLNIEPDTAVLKAYYKDDEKFNDNLDYIKKNVDNLEKFGIKKGKGIVTVSKVNEEDWENNWKKYYKPRKVGERIVVKPIWEEYKKNPNDIVVELDPGMAFGTGTHETTRMCIKALEKYVSSKSVVFDIGTGSGILSITSAKLGADKVIGVDLDPVAVESAKKNVGYNDIHNVKILHGNLTEVLKGKADIVVANIIADVIISLSESVRKFLVSHGHFICSGIIKERKDDVVKKLKSCGFDIEKVETDGEWVCIVAQMVEEV